MVKGLHDNLANSFVLGDDLTLDPALRAAANAIAAAHVARIDRLLPVWLEEERGVDIAPGRKPNPTELYLAVWARLLNELALWQIEPGDAAYERATLAALQSGARICKFSEDKAYSDFASHILRIQAMPATQRDAALATERQLLAHWAQARPALASWPDPMPQDMAELALERLRTDGKRPPMALPPLLASELLAKKIPYAALTEESRCQFQQWWLQVSLKQGATPAAVLNAFRFGSMISAKDRLKMAVPASEGKAAPNVAAPNYPVLATRFQVTGKTMMRVELDAAGKATQASVAQRTVELPGIRGVRPVAFDDIFDAVSVQYALHGRHYDKPGATAPATFVLVWTLSESGATPANTPTGATP